MHSFFKCSDGKLISACLLLERPYRCHFRSEHFKLEGIIRASLNHHSVISFMRLIKAVVKKYQGLFIFLVHKNHIAFIEIRTNRTYFQVNYHKLSTNIPKNTIAYFAKLKKCSSYTSQAQFRRSCFCRAELNCNQTQQKHGRDTTLIQTSCQSRTKFQDVHRPPKKISSNLPVKARSHQNTFI